MYLKFHLNWPEFQIMEGIMKRKFLEKYEQTISTKWYKACGKNWKNQQNPFSEFFIVWDIFQPIFSDI